MRRKMSHNEIFELNGWEIKVYHEDLFDGLPDFCIVPELYELIGSVMATARPYFEQFLTKAKRGEFRGYLGMEIEDDGVVVSLTKFLAKKFWRRETERRVQWFVYANHNGKNWETEWVEEEPSTFIKGEVWRQIHAYEKAQAYQVRGDHEAEILIGRKYENLLLQEQAAPV